MKSKTTRGARGRTSAAMTIEAARSELLELVPRSVTLFVEARWHDTLDGSYWSQTVHYHASVWFRGGRRIEVDAHRPAEVVEGVRAALLQIDGAQFDTACGGRTAAGPGGPVRGAQAGTGLIRDPRRAVEVPPMDIHDQVAAVPPCIGHSARRVEATVVRRIEG